MFVFEFQFLFFVALHPISPFFQLSTPWHFPFNYMQSVLRILADFGTGELSCIITQYYRIL